jgi:hypothetical protein
MLLAQMIGRVLLVYAEGSRKELGMSPPAVTVAGGSMQAVAVEQSRW